MRGYYSDPTAKQAIANVERERKLEEQRKKREEERLYRKVQRKEPAPYKKAKKGNGPKNPDIPN
ncbi:MAG: hypothetical protein ACOX6G_01520 [Christensenellales bacterium]|jgi:hypothetical protein|nr:hypothetical protein [Clostridiales bacterium]